MPCSPPMQLRSTASAPKPSTGDNPSGPSRGIDEVHTTFDPWDVRTHTYVYVVDRAFDWTV
jgi:hypothetical protein